LFQQGLFMHIAILDDDQAVALARLVQMGGFVQLTPESFDPPKLPIDRMTSAKPPSGLKRIRPRLRCTSMSQIEVFSTSRRPSPRD
jgi:hypothetical protein